MKIINHECYVSLEVARLLKEAGFDWEVNHCYPSCDSLDNSCSGYMEDLRFYHNINDGKYGGMSAPTLDVAQRWLREVKRYYVAWEFSMNINFCGQELYDFTNISVYIFVDSEQGNICKCKLKENYKTIEEAQEAGIKKALELILDEEK